MHIREELRFLLRSWLQGDLDVRSVHRRAEAIYEQFDEVPEYPRNDPCSIPIEVLCQLEILNQQLILLEDVPEILKFLDSPPGTELEAWEKWIRYWDSVDYASREEQIQENPWYSKLEEERRPKKE